MAEDETGRFYAVLSKFGFGKVAEIDVFARFVNTDTNFMELDLLTIDGVMFEKLYAAAITAAVGRVGLLYNTRRSFFDRSLRLD